MSVLLVITQHGWRPAGAFSPAEALGALTPVLLPIPGWRRPVVSSALSGKVRSLLLCSCDLSHALCKGRTQRGLSSCFLPVTQWARCWVASGERVLWPCPQTTAQADQRGWGLWPFSLLRFPEGKSWKMPPVLTELPPNTNGVTEFGGFAQWRAPCRHHFEDGSLPGTVAARALGALLRHRPFRAAPAGDRTAGRSPDSAFPSSSLPQGPLTPTPSILALSQRLQLPPFQRGLWLRGE